MLTGQKINVNIVKEFPSRFFYLEKFLFRAYYNLATFPTTNYRPINVKGTLLHGAGARKICVAK